jgi:putative DNA primase/helicase
MSSAKRLNRDRYFYEWDPPSFEVPPEHEFRDNPIAKHTQSVRKPGDQPFASDSQRDHSAPQSPFPSVAASASGATVVRPRPTVVLSRADKLRPTSIKWLWPGYLAEGKFHLLAGRAGTGKTTLALKLASTISAGGLWPDASSAPHGDVLIWSGEDGVEDTLLPRLLASGAKRERVHFVGNVQDEHGARPFRPANDTAVLARLLGEVPEPKLFIVDPVIGAVSGDANKSGDVRRGLQPLVDLAEKYGLAVLGITHFNKGFAGSEPLDRVTGSLAFGAVARLVMGVAGPDPNGDVGL